MSYEYQVNIENISEENIEFVLQGVKKVYPKTTISVDKKSCWLETGDAKWLDFSIEYRDAFFFFTSNLSEKETDEILNLFRNLSAILQKNVEIEDI